MRKNVLNTNILVYANSNVLQPVALWNATTCRYIVHKINGIFFIGFVHENISSSLFMPTSS